MSSLDTSTYSAIQPTRVVVFDIDDTLCMPHFASGFKSKREKSFAADGCITHVIMHYGCSREICSFPHLDYLVKYLLSKNIRIAVFSAGEENRNLPLSANIFTHVFGETEYQKLAAEGQFQVFSKHHQLDKNSSNKDLSIILKDDEQLEHCLLIDDYNFCCKPGQEKNFILVPEVIGFQNLAFYFMGLFKSYFDSDICETPQPISDFMSKKIQMCNIGGDVCQRTNISIQFALDMVKVGLDEVRKTAPNVTFYKYDYFMDEVFASNPYNKKYSPFEDNKFNDMKSKMIIICDEPYYLMAREEATNALMSFYDTQLALNPVEVN